MQFHVLNVSGGSFTDEATKKDIVFGSVHVIDDEIISRDGFAGQEVKKIKCEPELIHHIKGDVPGIFECQITLVGKDSRVKIMTAKKVK